MTQHSLHEKAAAPTREQAQAGAFEALIRINPIREPHWDSVFLLVKVQRPLFSGPLETDPADETWLVYTEDRSQLEFHLSRRMLAPTMVEAMGEDYKMYANIFIDLREGRMDFLKRLTMQERQQFNAFW